MIPDFSEHKDSKLRDIHTAFIISLQGIQFRAENLCVKDL